MAGLLDRMWSDPSGQAITALAGGLLGVRRGDEGRAIQNALRTYAVADEGQRRNQLTDAQLRLLEAQMADRKTKAEQEAQALMLRQRFLSSLPSRLNMPLPGGPTVANAAVQGRPTPALLAEGYGLGFKPDDINALAGREEIKHWQNIPGKTGPEVAGFTKFGDPRPTGQQAWVADLDPQVQASRERVAGAGATRVGISMDKGFGDVFAKNAAEGLAKSQAAAQGAASSLSTLQRMSKALDAGAIAGPTSKFQMFGLQIGEVLGVTGKDAQEKLSNTRTLIQGAAQLGLDGAKAMQGQGQVSNYERELVERASSGDIGNMTATEFRTLVGVLTKVHQGTIGRHKDALKKVPPMFAPYMPLYEVDAPAESKEVDFNTLPPR